MVAKKRRKKGEVVSSGKKEEIEARARRGDGQ